MTKLTKVLDVRNKKWTILADQIPDGAKNHVEKPLAIITSIGQFGIGKSFLQNILLGAIQKGNSFFEDETELPTVFPLETSVESKTKGIDMFTEYLKHPHNQEMLLSLWDAEGPSNPTESHDQDITVFALSAVFSQVLIYNVKEKFTSENMDKMQVFLEQMRKLLGEKSAKYQTLIIVVRDADDEFGYNWDGGQAYMEYMKAKGERQLGQTAMFFKEIEETFSSVLVFMMPLPNHQVRSKKIKVTHMRDIGDELFRESLQSFTRKMLHEIVQPGMVGGEVSYVCDLKPKLTMIAEQLAKTDGDKPFVYTLANHMKAGFMEKEANECFKKYQLELQKKWGELQTEATRTKRHSELKQNTLESFRTAIEGHYVEIQYIDAAMADLEKVLDERFKAYNDDSSANQKTMWKISGVIIGVAAVGLIVYYPPATATALKLVRLAGNVIRKGWDIVKSFNDPNPTKIVINVTVVIFVSQVKEMVPGSCLALQGQF